jgi:hypothetical protein
VEIPLLIVLFGVLVSAVGVGNVTRVLGNPTQVVDREPPAEADPFVLVDQLSLLAQQMAQPADQ